MALGLIYQREFDSYSGERHYVKMYQEDYAGSIMTFPILLDGVINDTKLNGWFNPLILQSVSLTFVNDSSSNAFFYDLRDLLGNDERELKITIDSSRNGITTQVFDGWVNSELKSMRYTNFNTFTITASNYVSKLVEVHPTIIDTIQTVSAIDLINECLKLTGKDSSIYVCNSLDPSGGTPASNQSVFNRIGLDTEIFWQNNIERDSAKTILEKILGICDSYLYYWDKNWYIERYSDLWVDSSTKTYNVYRPDISYTFDSTTAIIGKDSSVYKIPVDGPTDLVEFANNNQTFDIYPALHKIELNLNEFPYLNLTSSNLKDSSLSTSLWHHVDPSNRMFEYYYNPDTFKGIIQGQDLRQINAASQKDVSLGFGFVNNFLGDASTKIGNGYKQIVSGIARVGWPLVGSTYNKSHAYIATKFKFTFDSSLGEGLDIDINWKYAPVYVNKVTKAEMGQSAYRMRYTLYDTSSGMYLYNDGENGWILKTHNASPDNADDVVNYVIIRPEDIDQLTYVMEAQTSIPISEISGIAPGTYDYIFKLVGEDYLPWNIEDENNTWITDIGGNGGAPNPAFTRPTVVAVYGDININVNRNELDNNKVYTVNNRTLDSQKIDVDIYDLDSFNYKNCIFTGSNYSSKTSYWTDKDTTTPYRIYQHLVGNKFKLFESNSQIITSDIRWYGQPLKPLTLWVDEVDPLQKKYILTNTSWYLNKDQITCEWWEYNNTDDFEIITE